MTTKKTKKPTAKKKRKTPVYRVVKKRAPVEPRGRYTKQSVSEYEMIVKMLELFGHDEDNDGQIVIYTNHRYDKRGRVVPFKGENK